MFEWFTEFMESPLGKLISTGILAVAVLLLTLAAAGLVNRLMKKLVDRHRKTNSSIATVLGFVRYIAVAAVYFAGGMVIVGAIPVLSSAVRTLLATGGVIAVVAGLAAQEALGSVVSGVMILAFKPFKMGDVVRYVDNDITGCVEEITLHHTAVRTFENKRVIIPNSKMNSAIIENADYADSKVCVFLTVGITYESDLKKAKELLAREVRKQPAFLDIRTEQQKKDGVGILFVGEDLDVMLALCDKIMVLCHGKVMGVVHAHKTSKEELGLMMTGALDLTNKYEDKPAGIAKDTNISQEQLEQSKREEE